MLENPKEENIDVDKMGDDVDFGTYIHDHIKKFNSLRSPYAKYYAHYIDVEIIAKRIKQNYDLIMNLKKKLSDVDSKNPPDRKVLEEIFYKFEELNLDIQSFYIFVRALMDDICKIIKIIVKKGNGSIPESMYELLFEWKNDHKIIDKNFLNDLKKELSWFKEFKEDRDGLLHKFDTIIFSAGSDIRFNVTKILERKEFIEVNNFISLRINQIESLKIYLMKNKELYRLE